MFGEEAYPGIHHRAAALIHAVTKSHSLVDANESLALATTLYLFAKT